MTPLLSIGREPLQLERIAAAVAPGDDAGADGAVVTFLGLVRNHNLGRRVRYLEYEAYEPLALKTFERIAAEIAERWPSARLALHHRVGRLDIGEASVAIATRSPHRGDAYAMILENPPVPLRAHRPDAPEGFERILRKALAKQPRDRWKSAAEMSEALRPYIDGNHA